MPKNKSEGTIMSYDNTVLLGNLTRDPELRYTASGMAVCNFGLAVSRGYGEKEKTTFLDITSWSKTAEAVMNYTKRGSKVLVTGFHVQDEWTDKTTGQKRTKLYISATEVKFLDSKPKSFAEQIVIPPTPTPTPTPTKPASDFTASGGAMDDIPFMRLNEWGG